MEKPSAVAELPPPAPPSGRGEVRAPVLPPQTPVRGRSSTRPRWVAAAALLLLVAVGTAAWEWQGTLKTWLGLAIPRTTLTVSGNIEAHESVLGFKTVQSRIVELPFDEGKWVEAGNAVRAGRRFRLSAAGGDRRGRA